MFQVRGHECKAGLCKCLEDYADGDNSLNEDYTTADMAMVTMAITDDKPAIQMILLVQIIDPATE